ncbi:MAG TPA: Hsp20/alpha crystallin family protein [Gemmatimonadota bacterium]|nr:Hsp20/alpha crystallin family protein [Gemmatimonadota bacterium]
MEEDRTEGPAEDPESAGNAAGQEEAGGSSEGGRGRWTRSPWSEAFQDVQQAVEDVIEGVRGFPQGGARGPRIDLVRLPGRGYRVYLDLSGVRKEDVDVTTLGDELVVTGERHRPELPEGAEVLRAERAHGRFRRSMPLPSDVDPEGVRARLVEGVLEIALPLRGSVEPRSVEIE